MHPSSLLFPNNKKTANTVASFNMSVLHSIQTILSHVSHPYKYASGRSQRRRNSSSATTFTPSMMEDSQMDTTMATPHYTQAMSSVDSGIATPPMTSPVISNTNELPTLLERSDVQLHCGKYQLLAGIQKGSTASVYLAQDPCSGAHVAVKHMAVTDQNRALVQREVELQAYCGDHPNIAQIYDAEDNGDGTISIAMEYLPNGDLIDLVSSTGGLPLEDVLRYGSQIAHALDWMHSLNIAHRDLKCENVCLAADGSARIIDFGQAHRTDREPRTRQAGTKNYMAPECWIKPAAGQSTQYDMAAADSWSFGVLIYCLLTARFPWAQATMDNYDFQLFASGGMSKQLATRWLALPPVMRVLLEHLLVVEPSRRWNMATVCAYMDTIATLECHTAVF